MFILLYFKHRTLYKQGPYGGKPVIKRALIITPGSLVKASTVLREEITLCCV